MPTIGYETWMPSPPRKNGALRIVCGDIMLMRQVSLTIGGNGDQILVADELLGLQLEIAHQRRLLARRHVRVLDLLERGAPVVAEAHVARRLIHLVLGPRVFAIADLDELLPACRRSSRDRAGG